MSIETKTAQSAYLLSEMDMQDEAGRLRKQAALMLALELPAILEALPQGGRLADLGCGMGLLADAVAQARPDAQVHGFDADAGAVELSRRRFGSQGRILFEARRAEAGPPAGFPGADVAVLRLVLMHLPEPGAVLAALAPWLAPGGTLHVLEGDDREFRFEPGLPASEEVLGIMEAVQVARGGSRRLGRDVPALLEANAWEVLGHRELAPDPSLAAASLGAVFMPVVDFYLNEAVRLGMRDRDGVESLRASLRRGLDAGVRRAKVPLYHTWARRRPLGKT
jgi:SAM-dependent methyltransferase